MSLNSYSFSKCGIDASHARNVSSPVGDVEMATASEGLIPSWERPEYGAQKGRKELTGRT